VYTPAASCRTRSSPTRRSSDLLRDVPGVHDVEDDDDGEVRFQVDGDRVDEAVRALAPLGVRSLVAHPPTLEQLLMRHYDDDGGRSEEHTSELQSRFELVCRLLL